MNKLFEHQPRQHIPRNVNEKHAAELEKQGFNARLALLLTRSVGTMACAYLFGVVALIGFPGFSATLTQWVQWFSQCFIQLVMLSVLAVGQSIIGRKAELQAEEQYKTTWGIYHDAEQMKQHMEAQDSVLLELKQRIATLEDAVLSVSAKLDGMVKPARKVVSKKAEVVSGE